MASSRWDPFKDLISLQERMAQLFDETMVGAGGRALGGAARGTWSPLVDVVETETAILVHAEIPGVDRDDISVEVKHDELILRGRRRFAKDVAEEHYHRIERAYGKFYRSFRLPREVDKEHVAATFQDGVLEITLPKVQSPPHRQVAVS